MSDDRVVSDQIEPQVPMRSTHDPACDQCRAKKQRCERQRPVCSNCKRLNLVCEYSGRGKKPNQNTELMRRLRRAEGRIDRLETSLHRIQPYLDRIEAEPVFFNLPAAGELSSAYTTGHEFDDFEWPSSIPEVRQKSSEERDSIACLAVACTKIATAKYGGNDQTSGPLATLNASLRQISELQEQPLERIDTKVTVIRPPLPILQGMMTTYFDLLNDSFPMFSKRRIEEFMEDNDSSGNDSQNVAYSLCFNNIIVLTLMAKVRRCLAQGVPVVMELELLKTFLKNALGAFSNLESVINANVANVQALLSLSLVCQSMCLMDLARRCIQLAQSLWRLLDLQSSLEKSPQQPVLMEEHINIFWCIFILETSFSMNVPRRIPSSAATEMPLPLEQPENSGRSHFLAAIRVAQLRHGVLVTGTTFPPVQTAQALAMHHFEELQKLQETLGIDLAGATAPCSITNDFHLWTTLSCLTSRLVINEIFPGSQYDELTLSTARNAILILISLGMDTSENLGNQPVLPLLFSAESLSAISALSLNILQEPNAANDIDLLKSFHQFLKKFNIICPHITLATRLEALVGAIIEFATMIILFPDSCPNTDLIPGPSPTSIDFTFLDID